MLNAKSIKATIVLDPLEVLDLVVADGKPFPGAKVRIAGTDTVVDVPLSAKGLRKAIAAVKEVGVDNIAVIVQGRLRQNGTALVLEDAGIVAQPRVKKESPAQPVAA